MTADAVVVHVCPHSCGKEKILFSETRYVRSEMLLTTIALIK